MKHITRAAAERLFEEIGHEAQITVPVEKEHETVYLPVLNEAVVYNPYDGNHGTEVGTSDNFQNAKSVMKYLKDTFRVYSSYFSEANGDYQII